MTNLADALDALGDALADVTQTAFAAGGLRACGDDVLPAVLAAAGRLRREAEAILSEAAAHVLEREDLAAHADRLTTRYGCRNVVELVERATRVSGRTASDVITAARAVGRPVAVSTGALLPAEFPRLREALRVGEVGLDGVVGVVGAFRGRVVGRVELLAADEELAAAACGQGADAAPPASADELRSYAQVWAAYLDQDGSEPAESQALRKRGFTIGRRAEDGLVPVRGNLLPEVAAQLELGFDSVLNPRVDEVAAPCFTESEPVDRDEPIESAAELRTHAQKQHDALAVLLTAAATSGDLPTLGGAAPTLVVAVREEDLATGRGYAHLPGDDEPISLSVARHIACTGAVQRVVCGTGGRIVSIETLDRVFNHHQRRGITLRDGGCLIPGCRVPPQWCEIHHVQEHSRGGPTHTDNGVLLCWFHHRTIDSGGWRIQMVDGVPYVRGPHWWDSHMKWRPATKSPTRMREAIALRM
ncbi:HNH endonuclease signature motif containing protein [Microbacterium sp.]|uniref:HNH endonuclease signature motif containing protein n=1 Tax=Microbacterium sp. TaxID=51671 RepID=UPI002E304191|nr:DUF222 domain-containing protein [Microbacterium sp.]HEX5730141.1 DUF222 domain-containing protein [Microbacterium sp.]